MIKVNQKVTINPYGPIKIEKIGGSYYVIGQGTFMSFRSRSEALEIYNIITGRKKIEKTKPKENKKSPLRGIKKRPIPPGTTKEEIGEFAHKNTIKTTSEKYNISMYMAGMCKKLYLNKKYSERHPKN